MPDYLDLGPCQILFGAKGSEIDLGKTEGGVRVSFTTEVAELHSDQFGVSPEDGVISGQGATIVAPLADYTLANLALALNQDLTALAGKHGVAGDLLTGTKLSTKANSLLIKKYVGGIPSTDTEDWIRFPKAAPTGTFEISFAKADQRIIEVTFTAYPDDNDRLYILGDEDAATTGS